MKTFGEKTENTSYYTREGAYLIAEQNGKIAVIRLPKGVFLPGGGIEPGESQIDCIKRECLEETGFEVAVNQYLTSAQTYCIHDKLGPFHPVQHYYSGHFLQKVKTPIETDHELIWMKADELKGLFFAPQQEWAVMQYLSGRK